MSARYNFTNSAQVSFFMACFSACLAPCAKGRVCQKGFISQDGVMFGHQHLHLMPLLSAKPRAGLHQNCAPYRHLCECAIDIAFLPITVIFRIQGGAFMQNEMWRKPNRDYVGPICIPNS